MAEHDSRRIYIITGAAGHLGSAVTKILSDSGKTVYALCLPDEKNPPEGAHVKIFRGDIRNLDSIAGMFEEMADASASDASASDTPCTVIHCAGIVSISSKFDQNVYDVNVIGTKNIITLCEKYRVDKLVYISSVHAIPELPAGRVMTEVDHFSPDDVYGLYARTKAQASGYVLDYIRRGHNANIIHPSGITGPGDFGRGHITQLVIDYYRGGLSSGINGGYDFVDVRDVAQGIVSCCDNGKCGESYILSGHYFKVGELLDMLHEITGKRKIKRLLPEWFVRMTVPLAELYYRILRQPPLFTAYSIFVLNTNANFSHEKASRELEYTVRPMRQTLEDTVQWLGEHGRI
ncbi:MAG: NAD-dependent epimerase/dehydratase family protein [Treponema sp.]|nr:NAD-dependent epimerase/dehydratase family protein [Treponema sp.]